MKEKIEVYESLRNELIVMEELQRNVWIYMYVLFSTLFVLGLEWSHNLFLVSYIILIPFQCVINDYRWSICKMSTYIRIFFENIDNDMGWESLHLCEAYRSYDKQRKRNIKFIIEMSGLIHLGGLATSFYCYFLLKKSLDANCFVINKIDVLSIIFSIAIFIFLIILNRAYFKDYDRELEDVMKKYKASRQRAVMRKKLRIRKK